MCASVQAVRTCAVNNHALNTQAVPAQGFYNAASQQWQSVADTALCAAGAAAPGCGQLTSLPQRLSRHFAHVVMPAVAPATVTALQAATLAGHFQGFSQDVQQGVARLVKAAAGMHGQLEKWLLPGQECAHYMFGLQDVLRLAQVRPLAALSSSVLLSACSLVCDWSCNGLGVQSCGGMHAWDGFHVRCGITLM